MKKIVFTRPEDGGVSIIVPAPKKDLERVLGPLTEEQYKAHVIERSIPRNAIKVREIDDQDLPNDRYFRNAWTDEFDTPTIDIHPEKAKEIKLNVFRELRKPLLESLDVEFVRALEKGEDTTAISAKKQALRDITNLKLPDDIQELKDFMPRELVKSLS